MNDLKFALRQLLKNPGFTAVAVLTLAFHRAIVAAATRCLTCSSNFALIRMRTVITVLFVTLLPTVAFADKVDDFVLAEMKRHQIPGLSLAVLKNVKVLKSEGYGFANVELGVPATPETVYQLASITKCFTATAIMLLVEDGKLKLGDRISARLPDLPPAWSNITVRHLLTHTSGIKSYTQLAEIAEDPRKTFKPEEIVELVREWPLEFPPGERYAYSNTGYFLLGLLIEKISEMDYGKFLERRIFKPAGMTDTRVNSFADLIPRRAAGYVLRDDGIGNALFVNPSQPFSAGALVTSVADLARWDAALYGDGIVRQSTLRQMWTRAALNDGSPTNYGLGWGIQELGGRKWIQHNGGIIGFSSHMRRGLDDGLTLIVLANLSGRGIYAEQIAEGVVTFLDEIS
jgi:D-alanyl-D-alanine carboxypeptidase